MVDLESPVRWATSFRRRKHSGELLDMLDPLSTTSGLSARVRVTDARGCPATGCCVFSGSLWNPAPSSFRSYRAAYLAIAKERHSLDGQLCLDGSTNVGLSPPCPPHDQKDAFIRHAPTSARAPRPKSMRQSPRSPPRRATFGFPGSSRRIAAAILAGAREPRSSNHARNGLESS